jgi:ABC-type transport system substrate-binding protein
LIFVEFSSMMKTESMNISRTGRAIGLLFPVFLAFICGRGLGAIRSQEHPKYGGTLRVKDFSAAFINTFDPASDQNFFILEQLFDGLVRLEKNMTVAPALAEYWNISRMGRRTFSC